MIEAVLPCFTFEKTVRIYLTRTEKEWSKIWIMKKENRPKAIPTIREITRLLASMGGFLGRKGGDDPGVKTVWEGYTKLLNYIEAAEALSLLE